MGVLDGPLRGVSRSLLGTFGRRVVLRLKERGDYDPNTGATSGDRDLDVVVRAVRKPYQGRFGSAEDGGVQTADYTLTIPAKGLDDSDTFRAPTTADVVIEGATITGPDTAPIVSGGTELRIVHVDPVYSGDQVASYDLHVRR